MLFNEFLQSEIMQKSRSVQNFTITITISLCPKYHNQVQFVFFVVLCSVLLVLFSAVTYKRRGKKLISKTIKYILDSSRKIQFAFFYPKDIRKLFLKTVNFVKNLEMTQITGGRGVMFFTSSWRNAYENRHMIHL